MFHQNRAKRNLEYRNSVMEKFMLREGLSLNKFIKSKYSVEIVSTTKISKLVLEKLKGKGEVTVKGYKTIYLTRNY